MPPRKRERTTDKDEAETAATTSEKKVILKEMAKDAKSSIDDIVNTNKQLLNDIKEKEKIIAELSKRMAKLLDKAEAKANAKSNGALAPAKKAAKKTTAGETPKKAKKPKAESGSGKAAVAATKTKLSNRDFLNSLAK